MAPTLELQGEHIPHTFGLWGAVSLGWLTINVFGGMSFIIFFGLSAGGIPVVLYGLWVHCSNYDACSSLLTVSIQYWLQHRGGLYHSDLRSVRLSILYSR